jgi:hypothetical protein
VDAVLAAKVSLNERIKRLSLVQRAVERLRAEHLTDEQVAALEAALPPKGTAE